MRTTIYGSFMLLHAKTPHAWIMKYWPIAQFLKGPTPVVGLNNKKKKFHSVQFYICVCVFSIITAVIPYMVLVMYCACPFCKNLVWDMPKIDKNASSVPKLFNGKWPVSLGQLERQLKKVIGVFPITPSFLCKSKIGNTFHDFVRIT